MEIYFCLYKSHNFHCSGRPSGRPSSKGHIILCLHKKGRKQLGPLGLSHYILWSVDPDRGFCASSEEKEITIKQKFFSSDIFPLFWVKEIFLSWNVGGKKKENSQCNSHYSLSHSTKHRCAVCELIHISYSDAVKSLRWDVPEKQAKSAYLVSEGYANPSKTVWM